VGPPLRVFWSEIKSFSSGVLSLPGQSQKGEPVHTAPTLPGLIVMDASLGVVAYNGEALKILSYPELPSQIRHPDSWLSNKIRSELAGKLSPPRFVDEFRSARRTYLCRSFSLDLRAQSTNGSTPPPAANGPQPATNGSGSSTALRVVMLERRCNGAVRIHEIAERFSLTAREQETVQYLVEGFTSKEIAQRMGISPNTVKAFLRLVMVKMNVTTRSGIIGRIVGPRA